MHTRAVFFFGGWLESNHPPPIQPLGNFLWPESWEGARKRDEEVRPRLVGCMNRASRGVLTDADVVPTVRSEELTERGTPPVRVVATTHPMCDSGRLRTIP